MTLNEAIEALQDSRERYEKLGRDTSGVVKRIEIARRLKLNGNPLNWRGVHNFVITPDEREFLEIYEIIDVGGNQG